LKVGVTKHPVRGAVFGLIAGLGVALLSITHGIMVIGRWTPHVAVATLFLLGIVLGLGGPIRHKDLLEPAPTPVPPEIAPRRMPPPPPPPV
jgi:hypothetical protein